MLLAFWECADVTDSQQLAEELADLVQIIGNWRALDRSAQTYIQNFVAENLRPRS